MGPLRSVSPCSHQTVLDSGLVKNVSAAWNQGSPSLVSAATDWSSLENERNVLFPFSSEPYIATITGALLLITRQAESYSFCSRSLALPPPCVPKRLTWSSDLNACVTVLYQGVPHRGASCLPLELHRFTARGIFTYLIIGSLSLVYYFHYFRMSSPLNATLILSFTNAWLTVLTSYLNHDLLTDVIWIPAP